MDIGCTVGWTGDAAGTYYIPCDRVNSVSNNLFNNSNSSITLYGSPNHQGNSITINSLSYPSYRSGTQTIYFTPHNVEWNDRAKFIRQTLFIDQFLMFSLLVLVILRVIGVFGRS